MTTGFVICSRINSSRVPNKAFVKYNGKSHIEHLIDRLLKTDIPVYIAVPDGEEFEYAFLMNKYPKRVFISSGFADDPMRRMLGVAKQAGLDTIIRVTHDKIFVKTEQIFEMIARFKERNLDYMFSSHFQPGTGFEIVSVSALEEACKRFRNVEHVSYAIKALKDKVQIENFPMPLDMSNFPRLLVDYPEDVDLMNVLFASLGSGCSLRDVVEFMDENPWLRRINELPKVTIYTCAYNAEKWIEQCMGSVASQENFSDFEYILIDDESTDQTAYLMAKFCQTYKNATWIRNQKNIGLASSSNLALKLARGKFIVRLDADDFFAANDAITALIDTATESNLDAVYPNNYLGVSRKEVQNGKQHHHIGGALFRTAAINHVKFTEGLRNYEGLDFFTRARAQIRIGYLNRPTFVYRQHDGSMSKTNLEERAAIREAIVKADQEATYNEAP